MLKFLATLFYVLCIPAANWMIGHVGTCGAGPCVIPVWPGLMAPSGVLVIGVALCLRDAVQHYGGKRWAYACVAAGAVVSAIVAPPMLALASAGAFAVSELADTLVYGAVAKRSRAGAVLASGAVGLGADSVLFLWLAFGSLAYLRGQLVGKVWAVLAGSAAVWVWGRVRSGSDRWSILGRHSGPPGRGPGRESRGLQLASKLYMLPHMELNHPRRRFNGGFHDGASDATRGVFKPGGILTPNKPHFDQMYEQGYRAGHAAQKAGEDVTLSDAAWKVRCTCKRPFGFHTDKCAARDS